MMIARVRLPVDPLIELLEMDRAVAHASDGRQLGGVAAPISTLARRIGRTPRQVHRWIAESGIPLYAADEVAVRCGWHPGNVWGAAWWDACLEQDAQDRERRRERAWLVRGYQQVERARERGEHVSTVVSNDETAAADEPRGRARRPRGAGRDTRPEGGTDPLPMPTREVA